MTHRLENSSWINNLEAPARQAVLKMATIKRYNPNQFIQRKGDLPTGFYGVLSGKILSGAITYSGDELIFASLLPGDWFGEISILDGLGRTHDIYAAEKSDIAILPTNELRKLSTQHPCVHAALVQFLCTHCRQAFSAIDEFLLLSPNQRLAKHLIKLAEKKDDHQTVNINQYELSNLVGVSRQTINKILRQWQAKDIIERQYGAIKILSTSALLELIEN